MQSPCDPGPFHGDRGADAFHLCDAFRHGRVHTNRDAAVLGRAYAVQMAETHREHCELVPVRSGEVEVEVTKRRVGPTSRIEVDIFIW